MRLAFLALSAMAVSIPALAPDMASAQALTCSQVRLVVPYPAGGATDVASRVVAERLEASMKKTFVVENRGGATGNIGTVAVVNAAPDGCTLLINATVIAEAALCRDRLRSHADDRRGGHGRDAYRRGEAGSGDQAPEYQARLSGGRRPTGRQN